MMPCRVGADARDARRRVGPDDVRDIDVEEGRLGDEKEFSSTYLASSWRPMLSVTLKLARPGSGSIPNREYG